MNPFDETPRQESGQMEEQPNQPQELIPASTLSSPEIPPSLPPSKVYSPDLQISWSWNHLVVFIFFLLTCVTIVPLVFLTVYAPQQKMTTQQLEEYMMSKPQVAIGSTVLIYALVLFFLYVTLSMLRAQPFWSTLGWRKLPAKTDGRRMNPAIFFFAGCALSLIVFALTATIKTPENAPIEEVFKFKQTAILFVVTAVLIAPLAEETVFRGYLYPLFARWFGVAPSVVVTGFLFGLMHGPQLGGAKSLIAVMTLVGIVFTAVRARTGSVFASYLMHLGYNSFIGITLALATHGFTQVPTNS
jgi:membrane protease YdiL (CAAX protease family)